MKENAEEVINENDDILSENKLILSIASRINVEKFMRQILINNRLDYSDSQSNQTRDWYSRVKSYLNYEEQTVIESVNLITPENIHINAFMYEPLIDVSGWVLKIFTKKRPN